MWLCFYTHDHTHQFHSEKVKIKSGEYINYLFLCHKLPPKLNGLKTTIVLLAHNSVAQQFRLGSAGQFCGSYLRSPMWPLSSSSLTGMDGLRWAHSPIWWLVLTVGWLFWGAQVGLFIFNPCSFSFPSGFFIWCSHVSIPREWGQKCKASWGPVSEARQLCSHYLVLVKLSQGQLRFNT